MSNTQPPILSQTHMETWFANLLAADAPRLRQGLIARLQPRLLSCDYAAMETVMAYDVLDWELNVVKQLHNGIISTGFDTSMGMLCHYYASPNVLTTVTLSTTYLKEIPQKQTLQYQSKIKSLGRSLITLESKAFVGEEQEPSATATATFKILHYKKKGDTV